MRNENSLFSFTTSRGTFLSSTAINTIEHVTSVSSGLSLSALCPLEKSTCSCARCEPTRTYRMMKYRISGNAFALSPICCCNLPEKNRGRKTSLMYYKNNRLPRRMPKSDLFVKWFDCGSWNDMYKTVKTL